MRLNTEENLRKFLTNSKSSNYQKLNANICPINDQNINSINISINMYNQSKSNKTISSKDTKNRNKLFTIFSNLNYKQKEKLNISKFFKSKKKYFNNINLITEKNEQKKIIKTDDLNISIQSKNSKKNYKTLNYAQTYGRIIKYFTIKSNNKPMKFDELSQVFVPIRNTLSNEHRNKNMKINSKKKENIRDKINLYLMDSKNKPIQIFKNNKYKKNLNQQKLISEYENEHKNKSPNKNGKLTINKEIKIENDINYNNINSIYNNTEGNNNKNSIKTSYQFRIRKINLPSGINLDSIQSNNKLLHNLINKKSKKLQINNSERIPTDYNINNNYN